VPGAEAPGADAGKGTHPISTGRPRGIFLEPGQELTVKIEKIGRLQNPLLRGD
jgi:2-keto-4-pentenoate hydratase/2-oxohepta-3-ene-1,7-dioic acid hydratase in catechol pathway